MTLPLSYSRPLSLLPPALRSFDFAQNLASRLPLRSRLLIGSTWKAVTLPLSYSRPVNQLSAISRQLKPQRLKPRPISTPAGMAKAMPFHKLFTSSKSCGPAFARDSGRATQTYMEPMTRIELVTSPLPRECSTN